MRHPDARMETVIVSEFNQR
ncbi:hypothetical protein A2U01_0101446, partial [Trifolium medium]|nr:hypothetical protein [Trifolium medium]